MRLLRTYSLMNPNWQLIPGSSTTNQMTFPTGNFDAFFRLLEP